MASLIPVYKLLCDPKIPSSEMTCASPMKKAATSAYANTAASPVADLFRKPHCFN